MTPSPPAAAPRPPAVVADGTSVVAGGRSRESRGADAPRSPDGGRYDLLDAGEIVRTLLDVERRIGDRFPDSGLRRVCGKLHSVADDAGRRSRSFGKPILWLRAVVWLLVIGVALSLLATGFLLAEPTTEKLGFIDFVQVLEAGINDVVLIGAALLFLTTLENRTKRRRALRAIHELRAMAHIIDMHQLTKDPERVLHPELVLLEPHGDVDRLSPFDLCRYLDYCSDLLSLIGKVAALYVQHFDDPQALAAVNEVENLCTGLSRKIWQKIMIAETAGPRR